MFKSQLRLFITGIQFFTRIPVSIKQLPSHDELNNCIRYFPLVGLILGAITFGVITSLQYFFSIEVAVLIGMATSIAMTGGFHEDGLADFADSMGSYDRNRALQIMKDSRIGTYGAIATWLSLTLKFCLLQSIFTKNYIEDSPLDRFVALNHSIVTPLFIILAGFASSRALATTYIITLPYARLDEEKEKFTARATSRASIVIAVLTGLATLAGLEIYSLVTLVAFLLVAWLTLRYLFVKKFQGYTGDCLGAA